MKMHKTSLIAALALGSLIACTTLASAQDTNNAVKKGERRGPSIQQRVDRMATELKLTDDQKTKVTAVFEDQAKKRQAIFTDTSLSREQRGEKMRALMDEGNTKLKGILTPEQYDKYQKQMEQFRGGHQGGKKKAQ